MSSPATDATELARHVAGFIQGSGMAPENAAAVWHDIDRALAEDLDALYGAMQRQPELAGFFTGGETQVAALKAAQAQHWQALFAPALGDDFSGRAVAIGQAHTRIGLPSRWYMAAYAFVLARFVPRLTARHRLSKRRLDQALQTLIARVFLDMILSNTAYEIGMRSEHSKDTGYENDLQNLRTLSSTVAEVNDAAVDLAYLTNNTSDATSNAETISAAAAEMVASVEEIARNSESAAVEANATDDTVAAGRSAVQRVNAAIRNIATAVEETAASVDELSTASEQIDQILTTIEEIAGQTNLLALNATIEAARAGEAGKGFAVVAAEVKSLANQTAKATDDITQRIASLRDGMRVILGTMERSKAAVGDSEGAIAEAASTMDQITAQVGNVSGRMQGIATILHQQKDASAEIARSIDGVAKAAADNGSLLNGMAAKLQRSNSSFSTTANRFFKATSHRALCEMAKIDHVLFKKRVVDVIMGQGQWAAGDVPDHHNCRLGKWYDGMTLPEIRQLASFTALVAPHERVHAAARAALTAHAAGDRPAALQGLSQLSEASSEVLRLLDELSETLHRDYAEVDNRRRGDEAPRQAS